DHQVDVRPGPRPERPGPLQVPVLRRTPVLADLDLHRGATGRLPVVDLPAQFVVGHRGEAARAVDRYGPDRTAEQGAQWYAEESGFQVPQGDVDRADRLHDQPAGAEVAACPAHRLVSVGNLECVPVEQRGGELIAHHRTGGRRAVGPSQSGNATGPRA